MEHVFETGTVLATVDIKMNKWFNWPGIVLYNKGCRFDSQSGSGHISILHFNPLSGPMWEAAY